MHLVQTVHRLRRDQVRRRNFPTERRWVVYAQAPTNKTQHELTKMGWKNVPAMYIVGINLLSNSFVLNTITIIVGGSYLSLYLPEEHGVILPTF